MDAELRALKRAVKEVTAAYETTAEQLLHHTVNDREGGAPLQNCPAHLICVGSNNGAHWQRAAPAEANVLAKHAKDALRKAVSDPAGHSHPEITLGTAGGCTLVMHGPRRLTVRLPLTPSRPVMVAPVPAETPGHNLLPPAAHIDNVHHYRHSPVHPLYH
jgi:hypothetical protein